MFWKHGRKRGPASLPSHPCHHCHLKGAPSQALGGILGEAPREQKELPRVQSRELPPSKRWCMVECKKVTNRRGNKSRGVLSRKAWLVRRKLPIPFEVYNAVSASLQAPRTAAVGVELNVTLKKLLVLSASRRAARSKPSALLSLELPRSGWTSLVTR